MSGARHHLALLSALGALHGRPGGFREGFHGARNQPHPRPGEYPEGVSAERDELKRLVEELPDEGVPAVLAEARRQRRPQPIGESPPAWFGSFASGRRDLGSNHEDLLAEGFGRS